VARQVDQVFAARALKLGRDVPEKTLVLAGPDDGHVQLSLTEDPPLKRNDHRATRNRS
jgi:hypothetical protein